MAFHFVTSLLLVFWCREENGRSVEILTQKWTFFQKVDFPVAKGPVFPPNSHSD